MRFLTKKWPKKSSFFEKITNSQEIPVPGVIQQHFFERLEEVSGHGQVTMSEADQNKPFFGDFQPFWQGGPYAKKKFTKISNKNIFTQNVLLFMVGLFRYNFWWFHDHFRPEKHVAIFHPVGCSVQHLCHRGGLFWTRVCKRSGRLYTLRYQRGWYWNIQRDFGKNNQKILFFQLFQDFSAFSTFFINIQCFLP